MGTINWDFPPEIEINGRHYRKLSDLEAWERSRAVAMATKRSEHKHSEENSPSSA